MSFTIYRFTPPTCTLEIKGEKSPLSRWTNQGGFKKIQFQLRFDDPREPTSKQVTIRGNQQELLQLQIAVNHYTQENLRASFQSSATTRIPPKTESKILDNHPYLKSQGLVHHKLFFGSLIHDSNVNHIKLSTVQLFDLVTAIEAYQAEIAALPETKQSGSHSKKIVRLGGGIAATAIVAIGITTILIKSPWQQNIVSSPESQPLPQTEIPELDEIIPPPAPNTAKQPNSKPKLTKSLTSPNRLPPPPAVDTPKPKPDIPDPADYPLSDVARQSGWNNSAKEKFAANKPAESTIVVPSQTQEEKKSTSEENGIESVESILPPEKITPIAQPESKLPAENQANQTNQIDAAINSPSDALGESSVKPPKDKTLYPNSDLAFRDSPPPPSQTEEVIAYFEQKWQPPEGLKQSLEYRLLLNADGSIKRVVSLGKGSQLYLDQTNIPVNGELFISPLSESQSSTIRLLLNPDGRVQAFTE